jgi:hypothetical protein
MGKTRKFKIENSLLVEFRIAGRTIFAGPTKRNNFGY